ncbi:MAG TPA: branched-chain amino acid ABC transporter permease [Acidimicrobiales bacterium]|nr:branched-chain amino acid ABC transporter permease [Acidimicrobiales bacterium]
MNLVRAGRSNVLWLLVAVIGVVVAFVATPNASDGVAISVLFLAIVVSVAGLSSSSFRQGHPVMARAAKVLVVTCATLFATFFFSETTNFNLATGAAMSVTLVGLSFLTGISGQISLGNGAFMGVGAFVMAMWANHHATTPIVLALLIAIAGGAVVGLLLGLPATRLRGPYLAGMTLAFAVAFDAILNYFNSWTGGDGGLQLPHSTDPPRWLLRLFSHGVSSLTANTLWLTDITVVATAVAFFFMANLFASRVGRAMRLVRDNEVGAELVGVNLARTRVLAFVVSSSYAALGGALWTLINNSATPATYSFALSIVILSVLVIGGIGTIPGALIGGLIYAYSTNVIAWFTARTGLNPQGNLASQLNGIIFGGLLIVTMMFAPRGVAGLYRTFRRRPVVKGRDVTPPVTETYAEA